MTSPDMRHDGVDRVARTAHAQALAQVSPATMAQLHRRRHAALQGGAARTPRWRLPAAAFASLLVAAVGLGFVLQTGREAAPAQPPAIAALPADTGLEEALDDLDQNPDFYVWLASGDAQLLAME